MFMNKNLEILKNSYVLLQIRLSYGELIEHVDHVYI